MVFMALSPILVGMSQIINPDALFWVFSSASIFSYFALLKTDERKFIRLTALFLGASLLSKYTANILFPLFILMFFSDLVINFSAIKDKQGVKEYILKQLKYFLIITLASVAIFSLFMPAVFIKIKYLYRGTIGSPALESIFSIIIAFLGILLSDALLLKSRVIETMAKFFSKNKQIIFKITAFVLLGFFIFILINPYLKNPIVPLSDVKEEAFIDKDLIFPMLADYNPILKLITKVAIEIQPFLFSLTPIIIMAILFLWGKMLFGKLEQYQLPVFIITFFTLLYFVATLFSGVLANPRYSIILYPLYAFLAAVGIYEFSNLTKIKKILFQRNNIWMFLIIIIFSGIFSLWKIKPFYLNYESFLLPKKYVVTDAWGYGEYEAAQYLNSLPNPEKIIIWSDRSAICQFIKGKCIRDYKIDLSKTIPDYLVISRRGEIRHKFEWRYPELVKKGSLDYYTLPSVWKINIGGRPDNFVKIIKSEEKTD